MKYCLQITYHIDTDLPIVKDSKQEEVIERITDRVEELLPDELIIEGITARQKNVSLVKLEEGKNCTRCSVCGDFITIPDIKTLPMLQEGSRIEGKYVCKHCKWDKGMG